MSPIPENLCNRYMHGPIPMKIEICKADSVRVCLSPAQLLRLGSFQSKIVGLKAFGRRTHEDEWDEVRATFARCIFFSVSGAW